MDLLATRSVAAWLGLVVQDPRGMSFTCALQTPMHCTDNLRLAGPEPAPKWESMFTHCDLQTVLSVYFDDVKMAGPEANMNEAWALVCSGISTDEPAPLG